MRKSRIPALWLVLTILAFGTYVAYQEYYVKRRDGSRDCAECPEKNFCGLPPSTLLRLMKNYKAQVWQKTSDEKAGQLDARFLEISSVLAKQPMKGGQISLWLAATFVH